LGDELSFADVNGKSIRGDYEVTDGTIAVTTPAGLSRTAETLANMLLRQLHQHENADRRRGWVPV